MTDEATEEPKGNSPMDKDNFRNEASIQKAFKEVKWDIRNGTDDDVPFMFRRTMREMRSADFNRSVGNDIYYTYAHRAWEFHFTRAIVRIAYPMPFTRPDGFVAHGDSSTILGFVIAEPSNVGLVVHFTYVRRDVDSEGRIIRDYRSQGIAKSLIESMMKDYDQDLVIYTVRTPQFFREEAFRTYVDRHSHIIHNPYLWFTLLPEGWETGIMNKRSTQNAAVYSRLQP